MKILPVPMLVAGLALLPSFAQAEFFTDGKAGLELRSFYFNRGYHQPDVSQSYSEEWAQDFLLRYESGYTEGLFSLDIDTLNLLGVRLNSSPERSSSGLLLYSTSDRRAAYDYSSLGLIAKLRVSHNTLEIGTLTPGLPVVQFNGTRLHPQAFQGGLLEVNEISGLALQFGQLRQVRQHDLTSAEDLGIIRDNKRNVLASRHPGSNRLDFAGGTYRWNEHLNSSYHYANLENFYRQHHFDVQRLSPLTDSRSLKSDIRWVHSTGKGGGRVDNRALNALFTYRLGGRAPGLGYQCMSGDSGFAYLAGTDPYLVDFVQIGDLVNEDERSWQLRYDYDFAAIGLPRLAFMSRCLRGEHINLLDGSGRGKEWERDTNVAHPVQSEPSKNLGIRLRNGTPRSDFGNDTDKTRLIISYALPLWRRGLEFPDISAPLILQWLQPSHWEPSDPDERAVPWDSSNGCRWVGVTMGRVVITTTAIITAVRVATRRHQPWREWPVLPTIPWTRRRHDSARVAAVSWRRCTVSPATPISQRARSSAALVMRRSSSLSRRRGFPPQGESPSPQSRRPGACRSGFGSVTNEV